MNQTHLWKFLLVLGVAAWSFVSLYPPTGQNLVDVFERKGVFRDGVFTNILNQARELERKNPVRTFANLKDAVGTNDISGYFPFIQSTNQPNRSVYVLNRLQKQSAGKIRLGLDLRGGTSFLLEMDSSNLSTNREKSQVLAEAVEVLRKRVDNLGVAEPVILPVGTDRIMVQLPGLTDSDKDSARRQIEKAAFLEFRMVHPNSAELLRDGIIEPGYERLIETRQREDGTATTHEYLVKKKAEQGMTGKYVTRAGVSRNMLTNKPEIDFELDSEGADLFAKITTQYQPQGGRKFQLAIVLDGVLYSAPEINGPIEGGRGQITGSFADREAFELSNVLENPLEAPVKIVEERSVDPSLGHDSIRSGVIAAIMGALATGLFMVVFYFFGGLIANFCLALNILILMGVMASIQATLTLPGIAGIALTIGMAVDANVLIFERIREEIRAGKSMKGALKAGYDKAFGTIFDSNITTLISSTILIYMGTGAVKGFGVTLTIGVCASMFTALVVTRLIFDFLLVKGFLKSLPMLPILKVPKFQFMNWAKSAAIASVVVIVCSMAYGISRGQKVFGVDFAGGDALTLRFAQKIDNVETIRQAIAKVVPGDVGIQYQKSMADANETLQVVVPFGQAENVEAALTTEFPQAGFSVAGVEKVGPTVGRELLRSAIVASLLGLFAILVYVAFRYEFSFALGAVLALVHDVLITMGLFMLIGGQFSATMVAAILTIIGYSINDKIVILDRIREDLKLGVRGSFKDLIDLALNQTLSRTLITGGSVLLATLALFIFGGGVIRDFAFAFLVGVLTGTYSSIFIASAFVLWWHRGERPKASAPQVALSTAAPSRV